MSISELRAWLDARNPAPPVALRARLDRAIGDATAGALSVHDAGIASTLGEAALATLAIALEKCDERASAMDLLAADALMTYAMEAAAEQGGSAVRAFADAYGNHRLASLATETP